MINLLPPHGEQVVKREYWTRAVSLWAFLFSIAFTSVFLLTLPSLVLVNSQLKTVSVNVHEQQDSEEAFAAAEKMVQEANAATAQLVSQDESITAVSEVVDTIRGAVNGGIALRYFSVAKNDKGSIDPVQVQGTATTRETLAQFKADLERSPLFESATIPISDLARDADLPFVITIQLASIRN